MSEAIAFSFDLNQAVVVHEPIHNGCGKFLINKDFVPFTQWPVAGDNDGAFLIPLGDNW